MGLIKNIGNAVKSEVRDYLLKIVEAEKEAPKNPEAENVQKPAETKAGQPKVEERPAVKEEKVQPERVEEVEEVREKPRKKEIYPISNDLEFVRVSYKKGQDSVIIPKELAELIKMLPLDEYACFVKLYCFALEQKKNYGYWGGTLKRRIGLDQLTTSEFEELGSNLAAYGLLLLEQLTENQKTFVLYVPFDEDTMVKLSTAKKPEKKPEKPVKKPAPKPAPKAKAEPEEETQCAEDIPGKPVEGMENDEMYKSYKTFVSLEIDKAKMRVGRANFDKIYMEAVKYIDKKYGFKVLSDSDKFKEYLTNYYISAFDIPTFENWKKSKG
ncbi:hypothetical protein IJG44_05475 [bacterium]|nr:hypothetical protein [bacterium]MBQ4438756.1 hypothetical protein [bacterium]